MDAAGDKDTRGRAVTDDGKDEDSDDPLEC